MPGTFEANNQPNGPISVRQVVPLFALLALQVIVSTYGLFAHPLWVDEAYTAVMARQAIPDIHQSMAYDAGPPLYYDLLHGWRSIAGESEAALRSLSLVFALATTVVLYAMLYRFSGRKAAITGALLWAFSPLTVYYAAEARNYTLLAFLTVLYGYATLRWMFEYKTFYGVLSTITLMCAVYTHNMAWFFVPAGLAACIFLYRDKRTFVFLGLSYIISFIAYIPWIPTLRQQFDHTPMTIGWVEQVWSPLSIGLTFTTLLPGGTHSPILTLPVWPIAVQAVTGIVLLSVLVYAVIQSRLWQHSLARFMIVFVVGCCVLPYLFSVLYRPVYLAGRTDFFIHPFVWAVLGIALVSIPHIRLRWLITAFVLVEMLVVVFVFYSSTPAKSERDVIRYLERNGNQGDVVICTGLTRPFMEYYFQNRFQFISYPVKMEQHLAHLNEQWYIEHHNMAEEANEVVNKAERSLEDDGDTLWVIGSLRPINGPLNERLTSLGDSFHQNRIQLPTMGLRKLNEPLYLLRYESQPE